MGDGFGSASGSAFAGGIFGDGTAQWFSRELGAPTPIQLEAWKAIMSGRHALVSAPTGTGKTLAAFLVFIDRLSALALGGRLEQRLHLIYVSPLKSLAGDIRENLQRPLAGIAAPRQPLVTAAVRTGDTTPSERRAMLKSPPHILITTPESLYLLLTSQSGRAMLKTARAIIIDELHALASSKRGAHLMLSAARLDMLCRTPLQRVGLSATIEPLGEAAEYLSPGGGEAVEIVAPKMGKRVKIEVDSPLPDDGALPQGTVWPELARAVYGQCASARCAIAFTDGRMMAEKLAYYVNEIAGEGFARTHHGSLAKERRQEAEQALRDGKLRLLCATSSMELGIDVGEIDAVMQIGCPKSISSAMQRVGRAGHNPGRVSVMRMFPRTAPESLYCGLTAQVAKDGGIERLHVPEICLDVLAQHLVSMAAGAAGTAGPTGGAGTAGAAQWPGAAEDAWPAGAVGVAGTGATAGAANAAGTAGATGGAGTAGAAQWPGAAPFGIDGAGGIMATLARAYPFRNVARGQVDAVLRMLAGDFEHARDVPARPKILYDRLRGTVDGDAYSRLLALSAGGTIPDRGLFPVCTESGARIGEVDEEFVFEARVGDKFLLGAFAWRITGIGKDAVAVAQATPSGAQPPFWHGDQSGRHMQTGLAFGALLRELGGLCAADGSGGADMLCDADGSSGADGLRAIGGTSDADKFNDADGFGDADGYSDADEVRATDGTSGADKFNDANGFGDVDRFGGANRLCDADGFGDADGSCANGGRPPAELAKRPKHAGLSPAELLLPAELPPAGLPPAEPLPADMPQQEAPLPYRRLRGFGLNGAAARGALGYIRRQISSTGILPDDRTIIAEYFRDDAGDHQLMIHSVFGKKVNAPLALLAQDAARRMAGFDISAFDDDDGILLFPYSGQRLPSGVIQAIDRRNAKGLLAAMLPATPLFGMAFRYNAARALMMGVRKRGRQPLWIQRLRGVELLDAIAGDESHPLIWETKRECLDDYWDLPGLEQVLRGVESGEIAVREVRHDLPSPMSMPLRRQVEARLMYEYDPVTSGIVGAAGAALGSALAESAGAGAGGRTGGIGGFGRAMSAGATGIGGIAGLGAGADGAWLKPDPEQLGLASGRRSAPQDAAQLHALLMAEGDQLAEETESPAEWLEQLAKDGRALYVEPGLWIAAEHAGEYATALQGAGGADAGSNADSGTAANSEAGYGTVCSTSVDSGSNADAGSDADSAEAARRHIVRRALRYHGGHSAALIAYRYCWPQSAALRVLSALCGAREAVEADGIYYHAGVYGKAAWLAVIGRRRLAAALPPERYAALLCSRAMAAGTPREQLADALAALRGEAFSPDAWEDIILPARVAGYRQALLDEMLSQGEVFWRLELPDSGRCGSECGIRACSGGGGSGHADHSAARAGADRRAGRADRHDNIGEMADGVGSGRGTGGDIAASGMAGAPSMEARKESAPGAGVRVSFHPYGDFDWDARPPLPSDGLDEDEQAIYATLRERGAVFAQSLSAALDGRPPHGALLRLAGKGLARSDSLAPIRRLQEYAKQGRSPESGASAWPRRDGSPGALDSLGPSGPSGPSGPTGPSGDYSAAWAGGTRPAGGASGARGGSDSRADGALGAERGPNGAPLPGADGARGGHAAPSRAPARGYGFESSLSGRPLFGSAAARSQAKASARERAGARIQDAMPLPGRWELAAELAEQTIEQRLERAFDRVAVVCRETARDLPWDQALAVLRVWELTGRARRGYFIEGLPGAQFIRENDYEATVQLLSQPPCGIVWLPAPDPAQQWGKCLPHRPGMSFMNVPGTAVALCAGAPVAVFARFGQALRLFGRDPLARPALDPASNPAHAYAPAPMPEPADILKAFAQQFRQRRVFPAKKSVSVRQYSPEAEQALAAAGFSRYVREYVLYRE